MLLVWGDVLGSLLVVEDFDSVEDGVQLGAVEQVAFVDHGLDAAGVVDVLQWVLFEDDQVGLIPCFDLSHGATLGRFIDAIEPLARNSGGAL